MKGIFPNLLKTAAITIPLTVMVNLTWFVLDRPFDGAEFGQMGLLLVVGSVYITIILLIISLPALLLTDGIWWSKPVLRFTLYFGGPLLFVAGFMVATLAAGEGDASVYLVTGIIFLLLQGLYYQRLLRKWQEETAS